jgi:hypothetical protein
MVPATATLAASRGGDPGAATDVEDSVGVGEVGAVDQVWVIASAGGVVAVGVHSPLVAFLTVPGGGLVEVGVINGAVGG